MFLELHQREPLPQVDTFDVPCSGDDSHNPFETNAAFLPAEFRVPLASVDNITLGATRDEVSKYAGVGSVYSRLYSDLSSGF